MGDIQTHASIASAVQAALPAGEARDFFEIGNFLTDVSQFRDPYAHLGGKTRMWRIGRDEHPAGFLFAALDLYAGLDNYLDELMGVPNGGPKEGAQGDAATWRPDDGELAAWFRDVVLVYGAERFHRAGVDKHEFHAVFNRRFTQYYPHEHMDFPPWPHGSRLGEERPRVSEIDLPDGSAKRRLLRYLDDQLEYVADLLTRIEKDWAQVRATADNAAERRLLLALFGHASHALEDFFFHSNFVELAWEHAHPGDPAPTRPLDHPTADELANFGPPPSDVHLQRNHHRRRRSPLANPADDALSTEDSAEATNVYTSYFAGNDVFFTVVDALGHERPARPTGAAEPADLLREGISRVLFAKPEDQARALEEHHARLKSGSYVRYARVAASQHRLETFEVHAIQRACNRDLRLAESYSSVASNGTPLGILGMLQKMLAAARVATKASAVASAAIDADAAHRVNDDRSDNGAEAEAIGSHTLMAKDSVRKEPLRVEAVNLATVAATYVGRTMAAQLAAGPPAQPHGGIDWAETLRAFVGHPEQAAGGGAAAWWRTAMTSVEPGAQAAHEPQPLPPGPFATRAAEPRRRALEVRYEGLSAVVEEEFRSAVNGAFVLDSALTGALLGGLSGLVSGLIYGATDGSPEQSLGAGGLGLVAGGVAGMLGSLVVTGIGTAINERAGAVTGAVTSWTAAPVGAWFIGKGIAEGFD